MPAADAADAVARVARARRRAGLRHLGRHRRRPRRAARRDLRARAGARSSRRRPGERPATHRVYRPGEGDAFNVERIGPGAFRVEGGRIDRLIARHDIENAEALRYVEERLRALGVIRALEAAGFEPGDDVEIAGIVFELDPGAPLGGDAAGVRAGSDALQVRAVARPPRRHAALVLALALGACGGGDDAERRRAGRARLRRGHQRARRRHGSAASCSPRSTWSRRPGRPATRPRRPASSSSTWSPA